MGFNDTTDTSNTALEREFCEISEFVRFLKVRLLLKFADVFKWDSTDFGKWVISIQWWILDHSPPYESYIGQWALLRPQYNLANLKGQQSEAKFIMDMIGNRPATERVTYNWWF